ncbi:hypothetical protein RUM44_007194, partial [Polyplax serrata]
MVKVHTIDDSEAQGLAFKFSRPLARCKRNSSTNSQVVTVTVLLDAAMYSYEDENDGYVTESLLSRTDHQDSQ